MCIITTMSNLRLRLEIWKLRALTIIAKAHSVRLRIITRWHRLVTRYWQWRSAMHRVTIMKLSDKLQCKFERAGVRCVANAEPPHTHDDGRDGHVYGWRA